MTPLQTILTYHERTKHRFEAYAAGPESLDWSAQPNPFRSYAGAAKTLLPLAADSLATSFADLYLPGAVVAHASRAIDIDSVGLLLELSLAISAWKEYGPDRWALRCNPSSGNLHPTEAYVVCRNVPGLADGVHHYQSLDHSLELRCRFAPLPNANAVPSLHVGLTSITWREAWKYGERAFRYCQHDVGHALGALRYGAAALGWQAHCCDALGDDEIARLLGLDRDADFGKAEREEPELLLAVGPLLPPPVPVADAAAGEWAGRANVLDPHPLYRWPIIDEVAAASRTPATSANGWRPLFGPKPYPSVCKLPAATVMRQRRSAQAFDRKAGIDADVFYRMLDALLPRDAAPWNVWAWKPRLHPVLFVHRVAGIAPGIYALPRTDAAAQALRAALHADFAWSRPPGCPEHLPLFCLTEADTARAAHAISCHQAIAVALPPTFSRSRPARPGAVS